MFTSVSGRLFNQPNHLVQQGYSCTVTRINRADCFGGKIRHHPASVGRAIEAFVVYHAKAKEAVCVHYPMHVKLNAPTAHA
jgi:hypothetical protein